MRLTEESVTDITKLWASAPGPVKPGDAVSRRWEELRLPGQRTGLGLVVSAVHRDMPYYDKTLLILWSDNAT